MHDLEKRFAEHRTTLLTPLQLKTLFGDKIYLDLVWGGVWGLQKG